MATEVPRPAVDPVPDVPPAPPRRRSYVDTLRVAGRLAAELPAIDAVAAFADYYDTVTLEALDAAQASLGPPPCAYAWLALGSHARGEPSLTSDQDNALVLDEENEETLRYGRQLAASVIGTLDDAGLRPCEGGYMADAWCYGVPTWRERLTAMFSDPTPQQVVDADVVLDMRRVGGDLDVSPLTDVMVRHAGSSRLLKGLATAAVTFPSAINQFGRVRLVNGAFETKRGGLAPIVMIARLYGLTSARHAPSTVQRLALAADAGELSVDTIRALMSAHSLLTRIRLTHQVRAAQRSLPITDAVPKDALSPADLSELHRALQAIRQAQQLTALRFRTTDPS